MVDEKEKEKRAEGDEKKVLIGMKKTMFKDEKEEKMLREKECKKKKNRKGLLVKKNEKN